MNSRRLFLVCAGCTSLLLGTAFVRAEPLTVARLFAAPDLSGPRLQKPKISPDGKYVAYLQGKSDNKDQLDLWAFNVASGQSALLVDSRVLLKSEEVLSPEEAARRERQRTANLRGIVEYDFSKDGRRLLAPIGGQLYVVDFQSRESAPVTQITHGTHGATDARFSPRGNYVSFVRDQNIWIVDLRNGQERQLTRDGGGLISNGVAEFVAQEEMGRDTGYWWSPDETQIAYARVDDTPVNEVERFEIDAGGARAIRQRYPAAGTPNAYVQLFVLQLASGATNDMQYSDAHTGTTERNEHYLARVDWFPDGQALAVQRETRNQQKLDLLKLDARSGASQVLLTETSKTWVNVGNNIAFIPGRHQFVWASERSGFRHLYLYDEAGVLQRPLTSGAWMVTSNVDEDYVDAKRGLVFFTSTQASPLEQQLFAASLDTRTPNEPKRISKEIGWHAPTLFPNKRAYLDWFSAAEQPPNVSIRNIDGSLKQWIVRNALDETHPYAAYRAEHSAMEFGSVTAADGTALYYRIIKPPHMKSGVRYPVIVDTYGGPHNQYVTNTWPGATGMYWQILAQHGFVVFSLDNRGSSRRGVAFEAPIFHRFGKVEVEDQLRGVDFLKTLPYVDGARIGVMGWSYGGYMALMSLATAPTTYKAGVAGAPVTDWRLYDTHYTERFLGDPIDNAAGYTASSVLPYIKNIQGRLLLVHGMADDNVLFAHSTALMKELQTAHVQFDLMTYPGGKHGLVRQPEMGQHFYEMVLQFFAEKL